MHQGKCEDRSRFPRWGRLALLATLAVLTLSGCVRAQAAIAVSEDDLVSGQLVIASVLLAEDDTGPQLTVPPELESDVRTAAYSADGYVGSTVSFTDLSFTEVGLLAQTITEGKRYRLGLRRSGDLVTLAGSVDLTDLPPDRADVQLKVAFPGRVVTTNGVNDAGTISWTPAPGAVTEFSAIVEYSSRAGVSWTKWVTIVGASAVGVALLVLVLALVAHRRSRRGAPPVTQW